ncbi:MAG: hypothetical protein CMJ85_03920 [Planctomycetes bacterium]|nr:hypothetical protein [Planctomycetota bacterium]MDP6425065.1 hypothetical protein [Planctomycetota bacterium]
MSLNAYLVIVVVLLPPLLVLVAPAMFGVETSSIPIDPATGRPEYRPGGLLLAHDLFGFGFLLVHYLHGGMYFCRTRTRLK